MPAWVAAPAVELSPADKVKQIIKDLDKDGDGAISKEELTEKHLSAIIQTLDTDGDGKISKQELKVTSRARIPP